MELDSPAVREAVQALARQALPAFGIALALLLCAVWGLWRLVQHYGVHRDTSRFSPLAYLVAYLALGFGLIIGAAALFAEIAENLGDGRKLGQLDLLFSDTLRSTLPTGAFRVFAVLTHFGDTLTLTSLCIAGTLWLLRQRQRGLCLGWVLAFVGNALLNRTLKGIFERTRPVHDNALAFADGWSFPSGHASGSVVAYGMLAYLLVRLLPARLASAHLPVVALAAALAFTIGSSRVFIQVHFASDVLAGFASGSAWLAVCIVALELRRYRQRQP
ncbi:Phosphatidylglycerophosphatase B [Polaromonas sp. CG9_12]|uniref:phosphatase PAP2 family protein n=1 Tax=Polaromonas sp. CG_9.11 TaxID=2787730 RepID=UPI0004DDDD6C|nr:phosphatase PAP2 family protein [Polaromonas sp. CG_9.11]MBG6074636.1 undecaprenyl-diphosphatase [Polaromonas sp. CG_9.11]CDS53514.1 Phosphatidylglycerophosphatase B [Polaromonas sp. CG9_12]